MDLTVRRAGMEDFEAVSALLAELGREPLGPANREQLTAVYRRHLERPNTALLLALAGDRPVGFMALEFRERLGRLKEQAWVPDLIVTDDFQGRGAGKALLREGLRLARERGCSNLSLESSHSRRRAHQFYLRQGMEPRGYYFRHNLD